MKVLFAGDLHNDFTQRWVECRRVHDWIVELVRKEKPDLFVIPGDVYERASTPEERIAVAAWVTAIAEHSQVLIVKGNHDRKRDLELLAKLDTMYPVVVEEGASVHYFQTDGGVIAVAAVAWPDRASLLAYAREHGSDPDVLAHDALTHLLRGLGAMLAKHDGPKIGAGHFMVNGCVTSVGQPLVGQPIEVTLSDLALLNAQIVVMGHVHKPQEWIHGGVPMLYTGSPFRTSYGELEDKSVTLVEFGRIKDGAAWSSAVLTRWERIPTPCSAMYLINEQWDRDILADCHAFSREEPRPFVDSDLPGAEIRFRYRVDPDQRLAALAAAEELKSRWLKLGAADVQVEEQVNTTTLARAPEIAAANNLADKLLALWKARDTTPESPRRERLIGMAQELESEDVAS